MPSETKLPYRTACVVFLSALTIFTSVALAQQDEIPPAPPTLSSSEDSDTPGVPPMERIVKDRPRFYGVRSVLHPVSWVQAGVRPVLRLIERVGFGNVASEEKAKRTSGVKLGIQGLGSGSGFGPEVKPFHNNVFNKGMEVEAPLGVVKGRDDVALVLGREVGAEAELVQPGDEDGVVLAVAAGSCLRATLRCVLV